MGNHNTIGSQGDRRDTPHQIADTVRGLGQKAVAWALMAGTAAFGLVGCSGEKTTEHKTVSVTCSGPETVPRPGIVPQIEGIVNKEYATGGPMRGVVEADCPGGDIIVTGINDDMKPRSTATPTVESPIYTLDITALCSRSGIGFNTRVVDMSGKGTAGNNMFAASISDCSIESAVINRDPS